MFTAICKLFTMRLLDTKTIELHEFFEYDIPGYAILSHRWERGEITFETVTETRNIQAAGPKSDDVAALSERLVLHGCGLIPVVSIKTAALSCQRRLTPCNTGTGTQKYALYISTTFAACPRRNASIRIWWRLRITTTIFGAVAFKRLRS